MSSSQLGSEPESIPSLEPPPENAYLTELIRFVLREVWEEFYAWDNKYCQTAITQLSTGYSAPSILRVSTQKRRVLRSRSTTAMTLPSSTLKETFTLYLFPDKACSDDTLLATSSGLHHCPLIRTPQISPPPEYESIAPSLENYMTGDDPDAMSFVPFGGDPDHCGFNKEEYTSQHKLFAWEDEMGRNLDFDTIVLEAVRRLTTYYEISLEELDETNVIPMPLLNTTRRIGLMHRLTQRDLLHWTAFPMERADLPMSLYPKKEDIKSRLSTVGSHFCPNLNCTNVHCPLHLKPLSLRRPILLRPSQCKNDRGIRNPCGPSCYLQHEGALELSSDDECALLRICSTTMSVCPEINTCQLAVICQTPCYIVRNALKNARSRNEVVYADCVRTCNSTGDGFTDFPPVLKKHINTIIPNDPCDHPGPCDSLANCECARGGGNCQRNCRCAHDCYRRRKGCKCHNSKKRKCDSIRCPCLREKIECDLELCRGCRPTCMKYTRSARKDISCRNIQVQIGRRKHVEVRETKHGFGLFILEAAKEGDLITDYNGELIFEPTVLSRDVIAYHRKRNYVFELAQSRLHNDEAGEFCADEDGTFSLEQDVLSLDAMKMGNESRFINHSADSKTVNCEARLRLVNHDLKIGIYARKAIKPDTELLINYGGQFFQNGKDRP